MNNRRNNMDFEALRNDITQAPIPLLIRPEDVKKEFDKHRVATPGPFKEEKYIRDEVSSTLNGTDPDMQDDRSQTSSKKAKKAKQSGGLKRSGSSDSLTSSSTDKSGKRGKGKKRKRFDSFERRSFGETSSSSSATTKRGSVEEGREMFAWIIDPVSLEDFFSATWERRPLHIAREMGNYYNALLSTSKLDKIFRENNIMYGKNIDITSYKDGERETHNPTGRAMPAEVWDFYNKGCSIRFLNPQTYSTRIWTLNAMLQEFFGCFVGANIYLTPAGTQGFAPHYDDIEAFILQLEGKKHWKLYSPRCNEEQLPRFSSPNLEPDDIGDPIMDVVLNAGDILYFPRGTIHQACALPDSHSLHITISCYQKNSWGDFIEKILPAAIQIAISEDMEFRRGLPRDFLQYLGSAHSEKMINEPRRHEFTTKLGVLMEKVFRNAPIDAAADQFGKELMHSALPPKLDADELACCSIQNSAHMTAGKLEKVAPLTLSTKVRLLRANILRMVSEEEEDSEDDEKVTVYHCAQNSREFHGEELQSFEVGPDEVETIEFLLHTYPAYNAVKFIPSSNDKEKLELINMLWRKGLLLTSEPLTAVDQH